MELPGIRMCPDEWIKSIFPSVEWEKANKNYRDSIERLQWKLGQRLLKSGTNVIIEWGTWGQNEREKLRDEARLIGAIVKLHYLDCSMEELRRRVITRNSEIGDDTFHIKEKRIEEFLKMCEGMIQVPTEEEVATYD